MSTMQPALPATRATHWPRVFLWLDAALCTLLACLHSLVIVLTVKNGYQGDMSPEYAWAQLLLDMSSYTLGAVGAVLLLCRRRSGFYWIIASLVAIGLRLLLQYVNLGQLIQNNSCPDDVFIIGLLLGSFMRICYNGLYLLAASTYRKMLY